MCGAHNSDELAEEKTNKITQRGGKNLQMRPQFAEQDWLIMRAGETSVESSVMEMNM